MVDPASDFMKDYQALAQQSWDAWTRQFQQVPATNPFAPPPAPAAGSETLERALTGLKGYFDWMQAAVAGGGAKPGADWQQQLQQMFGGATQPFTQAFGSIDSASAESFAHQWQSWWQAAQHSGFGDLPSMNGATPAFGLNREQQMQRQALAAALLASLQASARYQKLIQQASAQGMQRLQDKLTEHTEPGHQIDSMKGLYDLWVDASEEAYADVALSDEFREAYGEMVNTQMRVRQLQQEQTEQFCRELGVPTRSEVSSLGERLQSLRREFRASHTDGTADHADDDHVDEVGALHREVTALKRQLANAAPAAAKPPAKKTAAKKTAVKKAAVKKAPAKETAVKKAAVKKTAVKKTAVKKAPAKETAAKETAVKKVAVKKTAVKKAARAKPAAATKKTATKSTRKAAASTTSRTGSRKRK